MTAAGDEARAEFLLALRFLTRLPVPDPGASDERLAASVRCYPAAGAVIGGMVALVFAAGSLVLPPLVAVLAATGFGLILTGALHEDGFADCCDGLGGGGSRERVLEIMRDSRIGSYGAAGLGLMLAGKVAALAALPFGVAFWGLVAGHAVSRVAPVLVLARMRYARAEGSASAVAGGVAPERLNFALLTGAAALLPLVLFAAPVMAVVFALAGAALGHVAMQAQFQRRLGGYTGDCLGAVQQCAELGFYLGLLVWL